MKRKFTRRDFLKITGGTLAAAAVARLLPNYFNTLLGPVDVQEAKAQDPPPDLYFAGTDGWIYLPTSPNLAPYHPDDLAPAPFNTYMFGFHNITGLTATQAANQKMKAQHVAPVFWVNQDTQFRVQLTNLGLAMRPDLVDAHTVHWHGFRDVIPFFDGEPSTSVSVPIGRDFTYFYNPHEPGTYMYHCHVEDTEHVQMGMTGLVYVRPAQDGNTSLYPSGRYAYNDGDGSTGFDREFLMFLSEVWAEAHWADSHVQLPEWSDYRADFNLLNGRVYPDTLAPNGSIDPFNPARDANGDILPPPGRPDLQYQPLSALVQCNAGERVLLRFANLGFMRQSMTLEGIKMNIVGKDATLLRGRDGTNIAYLTNTISIGAGEGYEAIFTAPPHSGGPGPDTYLLYNRAFSRGTNGSGPGGQMTEVRVFPSGSLAPQMLPNT